MKLHLSEKDTLWRDIIQWFVLILASVTVICVSIILILNACGVFESTRVDFPMALLAFAVFAITSVIFAAVLISQTKLSFLSPFRKKEETAGE